MNLLQSFRKAFRFIAVFTLIFCIFSPTASYAQEGQAIGRVLSTTGSVTARDLSGASRALSRRSDIFVGDTVITGPNGFAQLRMVDSAQISFKEDTEFTFSEYSSDGPGGAADSALMEMVRGGFRTISGTIGDDDADDYQVSTQFASIGIRGTTHEAVIDAGALLTGVYDGGTTISNGQGSLDTGEGANFDYTQTFPGQAPQGLLQQPAQLGRINLNGAGNGDNDDGDDGEDGDGANGDGDDGNDGNDGNDDDGNNDDGNNDDNGGGIADANDEEAGARGTGNQQGGNTGGGLANLGGGNTNVDPTLDPTQRIETEINPVVNVRAREGFEETGSGTLETEFIQPSTDFLALVANSGFNTDFSLSELQGVTGRFSEVLAFNGLADIGGTIGAAAVGDSGPTTAITALTMSFDLNFSANLAQVSNGFLGINLDDAPTPIAFNIFFSGDIVDSQSDFTIGSNSNRTQGSQSTSINLQTSFLDSILVDDGVEQALFSDFFFEDTQGLGVEGQALVGFATPVLSPADNARISDRVGFVLSRSSAPGAIFPGNVTELVPGQEVILAGNDLRSPFTLDAEPPYIFRGAGSFIDFTDGSITDPGERPYDFEIGLWGSSSSPVSLYDDFVDNSIFEQLTDPLIVVSIDPAPLASLTGNVVYMSNFDRVLGGSSLGGGISEFFTAFNVDFSAALITDGIMEFCIGGGASCSGENAQYWDFDYAGAVVNGFVVASPVENKGYINDQLASIFGFIEGAFTGDNAEAFVGGFNFFYDDNLDIYRNTANGTATGIPDTTVDGVFLLEKDLRLSSSNFDEYLDDDSFLVQEGYARILFGHSRPTLDDSIFFIDSRSRPRLVLTDPDNEVSITNRNQNLPDVISELFELNWERWEGPLTVSTDNLDLSVFNDGATDSITDIAFFSTFRDSHFEDIDINGRYNRVFGFIGEDGSGNEISEVEMSFDINFSTSFNNIQNGVLDIYLDTPDENWLVFFEGNLVRNVVEFEFFDISPDSLEETVLSNDYPSEPVFAGIYLNDESVLQIDFDDSNMQGVILDNDRNSTALLSSFYFRELTEGPGRSLSGQALVAREDPRFEQLLEDNNETLKAIVNIPYFSNNDLIDEQEAFDIGPLGLNNSAFGIPSEDLRSNDDVFFLGLDVSSEYYEYSDGLDDYFSWCECSEGYYLSADFMQTVDEHIDFAHFDEGTFMLSDPTIYPVEASSDENIFNLDMGYWGGTLGLFELGIFEDYDSGDDLVSNPCDSINFSCFGLEREGFEGPAFWLNYTSFYYNPYLKGTFSTLLEAFGEFRLTESNGSFIQVPLATFMADLELDFENGEISGFINAISETNPALTEPLMWSAEFNENYIFDPFYDNEQSSFSISNNDGIPEGTSSTSDLIIDLTGTDDLPILVGSIQSTQGLVGGGAIDFASIFAARETRAALLVESSQTINGVFNPGSVFFGSPSRPRDDDYYGGGSSMEISPRIGINVDESGSQDITNIDLMHQFDIVITGDSSLDDLSENFDYPIETDVAYYGDADMGYWDSTDMTIIHNELNNVLNGDAPVFWVTGTPMDPDVLATFANDEYYADSNGYVTYYGSDAVGTGSLDGNIALIEEFSMNFGVNFATGDIKDGFFDACVGDSGACTSGEQWMMTFEGSANGPFIEMDTFNGSVNGSAILGEMDALVIGTGDSFHQSSVLTGFSLYNALGDHIDGLGILQGGD